MTGIKAATASIPLPIELASGDQVASFADRTFNDRFCRNLPLGKCYTVWQRCAPKVAV